jgi:hypothetical protein
MSLSFNSKLKLRLKTHFFFWFSKYGRTQLLLMFHSVFCFFQCREYRDGCRIESFWNFIRLSSSISFKSRSYLFCPITKKRSDFIKSFKWGWVWYVFVRRQTHINKQWIMLIYVSNPCSYYCWVVPLQNVSELT